MSDLSSPVSEIMVPLDFSECSIDALRYAKRLAVALDARLHLLHVNDDPMLMASTTDPAFREADNKKSMKKFGELVTESERQQLRIEEVIRYGTAYYEIENYAEETGIDLIVIGNVGHSNLAKALLGSTTSHVIGHACCPVLSVRNVVGR